MADFAKGGVFRPLVFPTFSFKFSLVPWSLQRFQQSQQLHYITFSCYRRQPRLNTPQACRLFLRQLEIARRRFAMCVYGYVVMPEHVHLLVNEPERGPLSTAIQSFKQTVARMIGFADAHFWQRPILRLQCLERAQARRKAALHTPEPRKTRTGAET